MVHFLIYPKNLFDAKLLANQLTIMYDSGDIKQNLPSFIQLRTSPLTNELKQLLIKHTTRVCLKVKVKNKIKYTNLNLGTT